MGTPRVVAIGDSITNACSVDLIVEGVPPLSWAQWVALSTRSELDVYAKPGAPSSVVKSLLPEISMHFDLALIFVGVNNILSWRAWRRDDLESDLHDIIVWARARSERVALMQYPDALGRAGIPFAYGPFLRYRVRKAQIMLRRIAESHHAVVVVPPDLTVGGRIWIDGVHPTSAGHLEMGMATLQSLSLTPATEVAAVEPRADFVAWRRKEQIKFFVRQPVRGIGTWLFGR
jgi:lysophospholipase L1-like esterase